MNGSDSNTSGANVVAFGFKSQVSGDTISDRQMQELIRRLEGSVTPAETGDISSSADEPTDKTAIWWPVDPTSGVRIGQPRTYNTATGKWEALGSGLTLPQFRGHASSRVYIANTTSAALATASADCSFAGFGTDQYDIAITPVARNDTAFIAAPVSLASFGWVVTAQADGKFTLMAYNVPVGGIGFAFSVTEINPDKV